MRNNKHLYEKHINNQSSSSDHDFVAYICNPTTLNATLPLSKCQVLSPALHVSAKWSRCSQHIYSSYLSGRCLLEVQTRVPVEGFPVLVTIVYRFGDVDKPVEAQTDMPLMT